MVNVKGQVEFPPSPGTLTFYIVIQSSIMVSFISDKKPAGIKLLESQEKNHISP